MTVREIDVAFEEHYVGKRQLQVKKINLLNNRNDVPLYW